MLAEVLATRKDHELRGDVLQEFYDRRREGPINFRRSNFSPDSAYDEFIRIARQLKEHNLIRLESVGAIGRGITDPILAQAEITAKGVDVVEKTVVSPISIHFDQSHNIQVHSSSNVQIGNGNTQTVSLDIHQMMDSVDRSNAGEAQKIEAKSLLQKVAENPIVTTILEAWIKTMTQQ